MQRWRSASDAARCRSGTPSSPDTQRSSRASTAIGGLPTDQPRRATKRLQRLCSNSPPALAHQRRGFAIELVTLGSDNHRHQTLFRDSHIFPEDWRTTCFALRGSADGVGWRHWIDTAMRSGRREILASGPIVATDTAFSSSRFVWAHQIHKLQPTADENLTEDGPHAPDLCTEVRLVAPNGVAAI